MALPKPIVLTWRAKKEQEETDAESVLISDWAELTHECLINIISRLTFEDRWTGPMLVCKPWLNACKDLSFNHAGQRFLFCDAVSRFYIFASIYIFDFQFFARCPNLQVLSIKSCPHVSDASIEQIAYHCGNLKQLDISYCYEISHESLVLIGRNCPNLTVLNAT